MSWRQGSLFGRESPRLDATFAGVERVQLSHGAWFDFAPGWLAGHGALFDVIMAATRFRSERRQMYDRIVDVPRLYAVLPEDGPVHPLLEQARVLLGERYGEPFTRVSIGLYRDGRDSVAWHGDHVARRMEQALVATISLGSPRRFLLRPVGGGRSLALGLGEGDLLVMGGSCQRTWQHCVPKVARAGPRMALMLRPDWYDRDAHRRRTARPGVPGAQSQPPS